MTKEFEKKEFLEKLKEAKSEEELLKVLESADDEKLTDEELELIHGGLSNKGGEYCGYLGRGVGVGR